MNTLKLLIIDDKETDRKGYTNEIDRNATRNPNAEIKILYKEATNVAEGENLLLSEDWDAAIIDLHIDPNDLDGNSGRSLISFIQEGLRFPVYIVSGFLGDASVIEENIFVKKYTKEGEQDVIIKDILDLYKTGITKILGGRGQIEQNLHTIFWSHIAKIPKTDFDSIDEKTLLRYISSYLQEYLETSDATDFELHTPLEMYLKPVIKQKIFTGEIIQLDTQKKYFVITPACDIASKYIGVITLIEIESVDSAKNAVNSDARRELPKNKVGHYHYLPSCGIFEGGYLNFRKIIHVNSDCTHERVLTISNNFRKDIIARFSHYYARQGQPGIKL